MPDGREEVLTRVISSINDVPAKDWNACAGNANPFVRHEFLHALEIKRICIRKNRLVASTSFN